MSEKILVDYAMKFCGTPYIWGGDDPISGIDCSGLAIELLKASGVVKKKDYDNTAQGLFKDLLNWGGKANVQAYPCSFVFFGKSSTEITHVGFCISPTLMIEAGGGGSNVTNVAAAAKFNAYVRVRPILARTDLVGYVHPIYVWG